MLNFEEWEATSRDILNYRRVANFGFKIYQTYWGQRPIENERQVRADIGILARLLHHAFLRINRANRTILRNNVMGAGRFTEPAYTEPLEHFKSAHDLLNKAVEEGPRPTLLEVLQIGHDLEAFVRPNVMRLNWVSLLAQGRNDRTYEDAHLDKDGKQRNIGWALAELVKWTDQHAGNVLDAGERRAWQALLESLKGGHPEQISLDEMRNWIAHRDFRFEDNGDVVFNFHPAESARRLPASPEDITRWRKEGLGLITLLKAFEVMFRLHEGADDGGIPMSLSTWGQVLKVRAVLASQPKR